MPSHRSEADHNSCKPCLDLKDIEEELSCARLQLDKVELIEQRCRILSSVNDEHDPFTIRFPVELATQIFEYAVPRAGWKKHDLYDIDYKRPENLTIGAVCRRWRDIAWSTPRLWNHLSLNFLERKARSPVLASEWLSRSSGLPLFLRFYSDLHDESVGAGEEEDPIVGVLIALQPFLHRAEELSILASVEALRSISDRLRVLSSPSSVKRLLLNAMNEDDFAGFPIGSHFPMSPSTVSLYSMRPQDIHIDWSGLVEFDGVTLKIDCCFHVLQNAPNLVRCSFKGLHYYGNGRNGLQPRIIHRKVKQLSTSSASQFWSCVALPGLEFLHLAYGNPIDLNEVKESILSSVCQIRTFVYDNPLYSERHENFVSILRHMLRLERLEIKRARATPVDAVLIHLGDTPDFLPHLVHFSYSGKAVSWKSISLMLKGGDLGESFQTPSSAIHRQLQSASFTFECGIVLDDAMPIPKTVLVEFECLVESGFSLMIVDKEGHDLIALSKQKHIETN